ncbi:MAG: hypothetical protein PVF17_00960 [Ignavibacteria bacterium]|jgi:hypothetical protein
MNKITIEKKTNNFTIIDNTGIRDSDLSWKAKGLLTYLLHLPDDWQIYLSDLKNRSKDGRDSTAGGIKELIDNGYIKREQLKEKGKFIGYNYTVYEQPRRVIRNGSADTVKAYSEKPTLLSTNNNKLLKKTNTNKEIDIDIERKKRFIKPTVEQIEEYKQQRQQQKSISFSSNQFFDYYESKGWMIGKNKMKDWKAAFRTWESKEFNRVTESKGFYEKEQERVIKLLEERKKRKGGLK